MKLNLEEIKADLDAATCGPWRWEARPKSFCVTLCGGKPRYDLTIVDFERWGMAGATPRFRSGMPENMHKAKDFFVPEPGREHHADWHQLLDHPDANLIAKAPEYIAALVARVEELEGGARKAIEDATARAEEAQSIADDTGEHYWKEEALVRLHEVGKLEKHFQAHGDPQ